MMALLLCNCGKHEPEVYVFRAGHVANDDHTWHQALVYFGKILNERSQGRIRVEVYANEQLGKEMEVLRSIRAGIVDITVTGATLQNRSEIAAFCELPFLLQDTMHMQAVVDGPIGKHIEETLRQETGLRSIAYFQRGPRHLTSNRPIRHPDDLQGLLLRIPSVPAYVTAWSALGAKPTPMAFSEVFTALQQGTIEAQENPFAMIRSASFAEVQDYLNLTGHVISWGYVVVGEKQFQGLPEDLQAMFLQAALDMQAYEHHLFLQNETRIQQELKDKGMQFVEVDKAAFSQKSEAAIYNSLSPPMQVIYRQIVALKP